MARVKKKPYDMNERLEQNWIDHIVEKCGPGGSGDGFFISGRAQRMAKEIQDYRKIFEKFKDATIASYGANDELIFQTENPHDLADEIMELINRMPSDTETNGR